MAKKNTSLVPSEASAAIQIDTGRNALVVTDAIYKELVGGSTWNPYLNLIRGMPVFVDDCERDFGLDLYNRMDNDAAASAGLDTIVSRAFDQGLQIVPSFDADIFATEDEKPDIDQAKRICDFVQFATSEMEVPLEETLMPATREMLKVGHNLLETVCDDDSYEDKPVYVLRSLDAKPRQVYRFDVDRHDRLQGIQAIIPGVGLMLMEGVVPNPKDLPNTISPEKFLLLRNPGPTRDPRGKSRLRAAYNAWFLKMQEWGLLLRNREQFAGGQLIITAPENYVPADPAFQSNPLQYLANEVAKAFRSGAVIALPFGSTAKIERSGGEDLFWKDLDGYDRQIFTAILNQSRSNKEAEHGSKADSQGGGDISDAVVSYYRGIVARGVYGVFKQLVRMNYGYEIARRYTPRLNLSGTPQEDWAANATAAGAIGFLASPTQKAQLSQSKLGLIPDLEFFKDDHERQINQDERSQSGQPAGGKSGSRPKQVA